MAGRTLRLIATMVAKEGMEDELRKALTGLVAPTRTEPGCRMYELWRCNDDPRQFRMVEEWESEAALAVHFETAHMVEALKLVPELLEGGLKLEKYTLVV